jgi:peptide/nickel transport system permease protein
MTIAGQAALERIAAETDLSALELSRRERLRLAARRNRLATIGLGFLVLTAAATFIVPIFYTTDPLSTAEPSLAAPSWDHPFGTDTFGRDVLARLVDAGQLDFRISASVTLLALLGGSIIGLFAGYVGGFVEDVVMRFTDLMLSFPAFILALAVTAMLGNEVKWVIVSLAFAYTPYFIRLTRGEVLKIRDSEYVDAARMVGNPAWRIAYRHVFPNAIAPALVLGTLVLGYAILDASALGFLGIGIKPPTAEWGTMVADGSGNIVTGEWWTWLFPGLAILLVVLAFNWVGDGLRNFVRSA